MEAQSTGRGVDSDYPQSEPGRGVGAEWTTPLGPRKFRPRRSDQTVRARAPIKPQLSRGAELDWNCFHARWVLRRRHDQTERGGGVGPAGEWLEPGIRFTLQGRVQAVTLT